MGRDTVSAKEFGIKEKVRVSAIISGKCPMCETKFRVRFDGDGEYCCPCGYFHYYFNLSYSGQVVEDAHEIRKEEWMRRLQEQ